MTIRRILFVAFWLVVGGGMLTLLIAAIGRQKKDHCRDYAITVKSPGDRYFIDDKDVLRIIRTTAGGDIKGQLKSAIRLQELEQALEKNSWIRDAELYFDNHDVLHITATEREPIARLFSPSGKSAYLDASGAVMPLSPKLVARVPVFTGFPDKVISRTDSSLLDAVRTTALYILNDPFWMAQVAQIDITPAREFEMVPVVGNHLVLLGTGDQIDRKFHRLMLFYKNVLSQTGFDRYKVINVQYAGQVIGVKEKATQSADTTQLRLNVEKLLKEARDMQNDSLMAARELQQQRQIQVNPGMAATENTPTGVSTDEPDRRNANPVLVTNPVPMKPFSSRSDQRRR